MFSKDFYRQWWKQRRSQSLRNRSDRQRRFRRLLTEVLEERTVLATTFYETPTFPIANDHNPFGTAQPNMQTAAIDGLHQLLLGRDASDAEFNAMRNKDRKSTRLNSSHIPLSRMPSSA